MKKYINNALNSYLTTFFPPHCRDRSRRAHFWAKHTGLMYLRKCSFIIASVLAASHRSLACLEKSLTQQSDVNCKNRSLEFPLLILCLCHIQCNCSYLVWLWLHYAKWMLVRLPGVFRSFFEVAVRIWPTTFATSFFHPYNIPLKDLNETV